MGELALVICKIAEAGGGIGIEIPAAVSGHIHEIAARQDDVVGCCADVHRAVFGGHFCVNGILAVVIIGHVGRETEQTLLEKQAAGAAADRDVVFPLGAVDLLVGVHQQMQGREILRAVAVSVIGIAVQPIAGQFHAVLQDLQRYGQIDHGFAFVCACAGGQIVAVQADGNIDRLLFCCESGKGDHTDHHNQHQQNAQNAFFHVC